MKILSTLQRALQTVPKRNHILKVGAAEKQITVKNNPGVCFALFYSIIGSSVGGSCIYLRSKEKNPDMQLTTMFPS